MKLTYTKNNTITTTYNNQLIFYIEIATIIVVFVIIHYFNKKIGVSDNNEIRWQYKYYILIIVLSIIIIHNLIIGGWHTPKDFIFIGILIFMVVWVWRDSTLIERFWSAMKETKDLAHLGKQFDDLDHNNMDYNLPATGRNDNPHSPKIIGTDINEAHPEVNESELIWGNRPEHYDFLPDNMPGYLALPELRKLKRLQNKVKKDKNYKYLANIQPYDKQSHRPGTGIDTGFLLHRKHGLDNLLLDAATPENRDTKKYHEAYKMPKEVLDALDDTPGPRCLWKEGRNKSADVKSINKYKRNNGIPGSKYKFLKEPDEKLITGNYSLHPTCAATTTTRPNDLKTSPSEGKGPVMQEELIIDEMIEANNKFRTVEYFTPSQTIPSRRIPPNLGMIDDSNPYASHSDAINMKLPGSSDKINQYCTNYPLVSKKSLEIINDNCARRIDGSCPNPVKKICN